MTHAPAFSLIELLAAVVITGVLATLGFGAYRAGLAAGDRARSASNLKVLILATQLYASENGGEFPKYREDIRGQEKNGVRWWFGLESWSSVGRSEGQREIDGEGGPLGPYLGSFVSGGPAPAWLTKAGSYPNTKTPGTSATGITKFSGPTPGSAVRESGPSLGAKISWSDRLSSPSSAPPPNANPAIPRRPWRNFTSSTNGRGQSTPASANRPFSPLRTAT